MNTQNQVEEYPDNVVPMVRPAPKPPGTGVDWLRSIPKETRFLARRKMNKGPLLDSYGVAYREGNAVLLASESPNGPGYVFIWVDSPLFSAQNELYLILPKTEPDEEAGQPQETKDG